MRMAMEPAKWILWSMRKTRIRCCTKIVSIMKAKTQWRSLTVKTIADDEWEQQLKKRLMTLGARQYKLQNKKAANGSK
jgi:hypothetical protein